MGFWKDYRVFRLVELWDFVWIFTLSFWFADQEYVDSLSAVQSCDNLSNDNEFQFLTALCCYMTHLYGLCWFVFFWIMLILGYCVFLNNGDTRLLYLIGYMFFLLTVFSFRLASYAMPWSSGHVNPFLDIHFSKACFSFLLHCKPCLICWSGKSFPKKLA